MIRRWFRLAVLLGVALGATACGVLPYTGPPGTNTTEMRLHGHSG